MTEISRPWGGIAVGDSGPYSHQQWAEIWAVLMAANMPNQGVLINQLNNLLAGGWGPGPGYTLQTGRALVDGCWYKNNANLNLVAANPAVNPRVDRVVLRKNFAAQTVRATVILGAEAASPVAPALVQVAGVTWDIPLWQFYRTVAGSIFPYIDERQFIGLWEKLSSLNTEGGTFHFAEFSDDFMGALGHWAYTTSDATGAFVTDTGYFGVYAFTSAVAAAGAANIATPVTRPFTIANYSRFKFAVSQTAAHANVKGRCGMFSAVPVSATPDPAEGVYFRYNGAGNWFAVTRTGAAETATDTGVVPTNVMKEFEIRYVGGYVSFFINGVLVAVNSTNMPAGATGLLACFGINYSVAPTAAERLRVDWMQWIAWVA